jgi:hypothetical protein
MVFIERVKQSLRRLQWKLTLSYTAVTVLAGCRFNTGVLIVFMGFSAPRYSKQRALSQGLDSGC